MSSLNDSKILRALVRNDFVAFIEKCMPTLAPAVKLWRNWHIEALAYHLELCRQGKIRRLIITLPPRHLKSICASVAFPAWVLGHDPTRRVMCVSYSADLAASHARDTREVMEASWYREAFPGTRLSRKRAADMEFMTTKRGYRYATSLGGTLTGRGGDIVIIDDPMKAEDVFSEVQRARAIQWYRETLVTRLDDKRNDCIILVMQRLHVDDLAGQLLESEDWVHLNLPAIATHDEAIEIGDGITHHRKAGDLLHPEREPREVLDRLRRELGDRGYEAQYQQEPVAPDGVILRWGWFRYAADDEELLPTDKIVQSWDTASKAGITNDYSVCTTWRMRGNQYLLLDVYRARLEFPDLRRKVIAHAADWRANTVLIEDAASGQALLQDLRRNRPSGARWTLEATQPYGDKVARAEAVSVTVEGGQVSLIQGATYLSALRSEIINFPRGHDDQVDSLTQFLHWVGNRVVYPTKIKVIWPGG